MQFLPGFSFLVRMVLGFIGLTLIAYAFWKVLTWRWPTKLAVIVVPSCVILGRPIYKEIYRPRPILEFSMFAHKLPRSTQDTLGDIQWQRSYIDTRVWVANIGDGPADNIDLVLRTDAMILGLAQVTNIPNVRVRTNGRSIEPIAVDESGGMVSLSESFLESKRLRIEIPRLSTKDRAEFVLALASTHPPDETKPRRLPTSSSVEGRYQDAEGEVRYSYTIGRKDLVINIVP